MGTRPGGRLGFDACTLTVDPLRSRLVRPFLATMGSSDSRTGVATQRGPLRFLDFSFPTRCLQSPRGPNDCTQVSLHHRLQASPYQTGWPLPCSVTRLYRAKRQPAIEFTCVTARRFAAPGFGLGITPFTASLATCWTPIYHVDYFSYQ